MVWNRTSGKTVWKRNYAESVIITGLPAGEYTVSVYDQKDNFLNKAQSAYQHNESLIADSGGNADSSSTLLITYLLVSSSLYAVTESSIAAVIAGYLAVIISLITGFSAAAITVIALIIGFSAAAITITSLSAHYSTSAITIIALITVFSAAAITVIALIIGFSAAAITIIVLITGFSAVAITIISLITGFSAVAITILVLITDFSAVAIAIIVLIVVVYLCMTNNKPAKNFLLIIVVCSIPMYERIMIQSRLVAICSTVYDS